MSKISGQEFTLPAVPFDSGMFTHLEERLGRILRDDEWPVRFAVTRRSDDSWHCEIANLELSSIGGRRKPASIFQFVPRAGRREEPFVTAFLVPTGIGAAVGGHSGDATPAAQLLASASDILVTHPNVLNAGDINEMTPNMLYVEGSVISRLLMGTVGLAPVRANRILAIVGSHRERVFLEAAVNICNAARASAGINVTRAVLLEDPLEMDSTYSPAGTALGNIAGFEHLCAAIDRHAGTFDAVAISSMVSVPPEIHDRYFHEVAVINPYGGVEAMLTHAVSSLYDLPTAHAPMYEDWERWNQSAGIMDPRLAAEGISLPFLFSVLKGLHRSPRIVPVTPGQDFEAGTYTAADVDCLVLPEGCLGLPVMAAIAQSIPIIFVRDDTNMAKNSIEDLASAGADVRLAQNYVEAAGMVCALRAGIHLNPKPMPLDGASALRPDLEVTESKAI